MGKTSTFFLLIACLIGYHLSLCQQVSFSPGVLQYNLLSFQTLQSGQSVSWLNIFPLNIKVFNIVAHPTQSKSIYAITKQGLFATTNSGLFWNPVMISPSGPREEVTWGTLTFDPTNPRILYLSLSSNNGGKLWRSLDAGQKWETIGEKIIQGSIYSLQIDPLSNQVMYAATSTGLYKTLNGGQSWGKLFQRECWNLRIDPNNTERIFFVSPSQTLVLGRSIFLSQDGGKTVSEITITFPTITEDYFGKRKELGKPNQVRGYSINPNNTSHILAASGHDGVASSFLVQSTDGGNTWVEVMKGIYNFAWDYGTQNPNTIYLATKLYDKTSNKYTYTLLLSQDNAANWSTLNYPADSGPTALVTTEDNTLYLCADGIYKSTDGGLSWIRIHFGLPSNTSGYELLTSDYVDPSFYVAFENGFWKVQDYGRKWKFISVLDRRDRGFSLKQMIINPDNTRYLLATGILFRQASSESSFETLSLSSLPYYFSAFPSDANQALLISAPKSQIVAGNYPSLISKTDDAGFSWTDIEWSKAISNEASPFSNSLGLLAIHPTKPQVYACISNRLLMSNDLGAKWLDISGKISRILRPIASSAGRLIAVVFDPKDRNIVYLVTQNGGIISSVDGGNSWKPLPMQKFLSSKIEVYDFAVLDSAPNTFLLTTSGGVFRSIDRGTSWKSLDEGLFPGDKPQKIVANQSMVLVQGNSGIYLLTDPNLINKISMPPSFDR